MNRAQIEVYKKSSDDWYGNYYTELVLIGFTHLIAIPSCNHTEQWRVSAWGNDDFGMIKDFDNRDEAFNCFISVINLEDVTHDSLKELGFEIF